MTISFTNYVDITSYVAGAESAVTERELITRIFSTNPLIPTNSFAEFTSAQDVEDYFGSGSEEYEAAAFYFSFISKNGNTPQKISFASWVQTNQPPRIYGDPTNTATLAALNAITAGTLNLQLGASTLALTAIDLASAGSFAAVATALTTLIQAAAGGDPVVAGAVVTYQPSNPLGALFELVGGGTAGAGTVAVTAGENPAIDVGILLGWESPAAIFSQGAVAQSLTNTMIASVAASNNFATFDFLETLDEAQFSELATWLNGKNLEFMQLVPVLASNASEISAAIVELAGNVMTLSPVTGQFPELLPGMILAATDYTNANASQNYMYQQTPGLSATVTDDNDQKAYDALAVNYYGQTQQAGQQINFYQRGVVTGPATSPSDINVFANEIWFKSYVGDAFMTALLTLNEIPANTAGIAIGNSILQQAVTQATVNGVISVGNALSQSQIAAIKNLTPNSPNAWQQVQTIGYWFSVSFSSTVTQQGRTEYQLDYTLIYTKNNAIRKVVGTHNLI